MGRTTGTYLRSDTSGETGRSFIPYPLPPEPGLALTPADYDLIEKANQAIGRLDGMASVLPDAALFVYSYVRKEAVLSSQIEGTQSSLSDLLLFESKEKPGVPLDDVREVSNYVAAMSHALERIREDGFPLSLRLIRDAHRMLLSKGRGNQRDPGEFRRSQNWIGGTRPGNAIYVPPPADRVIECMGHLEKFLHDDPVRTPVLIKAGLAHVQFESIHPFLDGNGRMGRLLITLLLCAEGVLQEPLLYLSLYFKQHRAQYYDLLQAVREKGDWEGWLRFFLEGVYQTAQQAVATSKAILQLFEEDRKRISAAVPARRSLSILRVHEQFQKHPILMVARIARNTGLTAPTVAGAITAMTKLGIVQEITGRQRDRQFAYDPYLRILNEGTERPGS